MIEIDAAKSEALSTLCQRYAVRKLKLFGSAVGSRFDENSSDLDFLVEFDAPPPTMRLAEQFFGFHEELQRLFGRPVDLLEEHAIQNTRLRRSAQEESVTLYAA